MPDKAGAFLKAAECFSRHNINIKRVSYNKAVDTHTLFIEAEGDEEQLSVATAELNEIGYMSNRAKSRNVILLEFELEDKPSELIKIVQLIDKYKFNISYISAIEKSVSYRPVRMGLLVEDKESYERFFDEAKKICPVFVVEYNSAEVNFDNSIFYQSFVDKLAADAQLGEEDKPVLAVAINRAMHMMDERNLSPKTTFECIANFAAHLNKFRGENFKPRITTHQITDKTTITVIEPPCGSNVNIIKSGDEYLFVDSGYSLYKDEMVKLFDEITGGFDSIKKIAFLTHADVDHAGLLHLFDKVYTSDQSKRCLELDFERKRGFREKNPLHIPYVRICKVLTSYKAPNPDKLEAIFTCDEEQLEPIYRVGDFSFGDLSFEVYATQGGHLQGELVLIDREHSIAFSGDVYVNVHGLISEQAEHNKYAPILMTSVDSNPALAKVQRNILLRMVGDNPWKIFCGHGQVKEFSNAPI